MSTILAVAMVHLYFAWFYFIQLPLSNIQMTCVMSYSYQVWESEIRDMSMISDCTDSDN